MSIVDDIEDAIRVHCAWADRLKAAIATGASEMTVDIAANDGICPFGRWLHGATIPESAKAFHSYDHSVQIHREFHQCAAEVLELALSGEAKEALLRMSDASDYVTISVMLTLTLRAWQIDIQHAAEAAA